MDASVLKPTDTSRNVDRLLRSPVNSLTLVLYTLSGTTRRGLEIFDLALLRMYHYTREDK